MRVNNAYGSIINNIVYDQLFFVLTNKRLSIRVTPPLLSVILSSRYLKLKEMLFFNYTKFIWREAGFSKCGMSVLDAFTNFLTKQNKTKQNKRTQ